MVTRRHCPELPWGKAEGSRLKTIGRHNEGVIDLAAGAGEDTAVGHRGILTPDLDEWHPSMMLS